jgi:hypothetical protein
MDQLKKENDPWYIVLQFFNGDNERATEWFQKYHPYLGTTPINYVKKYGTEKLFLKLWKEKIHER